MNRKLFLVISIMLLAGTLIVPASGITNGGAMNANPSTAVEMAGISPPSTTVFLHATGKLALNARNSKTHQYTYYVSITAINDSGVSLFGGTTVFWSVAGQSGHTTIVDHSDSPFGIT